MKLESSDSNSAGNRDGTLNLLLSGRQIWAGIRQCSEPADLKSREAVA